MSEAYIAFDARKALEVVWEGLNAYREDLIPEGNPEHDAQWEEIATSMAQITEALGERTDE